MTTQTIPATPPTGTNPPIDNGADRSDGTDGTDDSADRTDGSDGSDGSDRPDGWMGRVYRSLGPTKRDL